MSPVEIIPVGGLPEFGPNDDLPSLLAAALREAIRSGDVVAVTQKIVSKAEGRVVPEEEGREGVVMRETRRVVARRGDLVIAETRHGFVCANAGVDASNVAEGFLTLLPEDPDRSAERIRVALAEAAGGPVGVVVTDTFGRPWRRGLVNVAIGCAGLPALVDLRGTPDHTGRILEATVVALADEVAAASGLVMGKAARVPVAIVRGLDVAGQGGSASELVRPPEEDLFRESPLQSIHGRRSVREFGPGPVLREALEEAVRTACTAPAPDQDARPWLFVVLESDAAKKRLLAAMSDAWSLGAPPAIVVPAVRGSGTETESERDALVLSGGAAVQNLLLALHDQGLASSWELSTVSCADETRTSLGLDDGWIPLGAVAVGPRPEEQPPARPPLPIEDHVRFQ